MSWFVLALSAIRTFCLLGDLWAKAPKRRLGTLCALCFWVLLALAMWIRHPLIIAGVMGFGFAGFVIRQSWNKTLSAVDREAAHVFCASSNISKLINTFMPSVERTAALGSGANRYLLEYISHRNTWVRRWALGALGTHGDACVARELVRWLEQADGPEKGFAIESLGKIGDPESVPILVRHLTEGEFGTAALKALNAMSARTVAPQIAHAVEVNREAHFTYEAVTVLLNWDRLDELAVRWGDFTTEVKSYVLIGLPTEREQLQGSRVASLLKRAASDRDESIAVQAVAAAASLGIDLP